jgi:predicted CoA-binding protein
VFKDLSPLLASHSAVIAIVGATDNLEKYGAIIYRDLKARGYRTLAVNPYRAEVDEDPCYPDLTALPAKPDIIDFVVPPDIGLGVAKEALRLGLSNIWLQPGAESPELIELLTNSGVDFTHDSCIMVRSRQASHEHRPQVPR